MPLYHRHHDGGISFSRVKTSDFTIMNQNQIICKIYRFYLLT